MGLLPILLLFSYCSLGFADPVPAIDVDCDNEHVFEAVDEALKSYNEAKVDGNQFILYRITEAKIKQENESLTHYFVNFETRESVCPLKVTPWKQCALKPEDAERGECSAHILVNTAQNTKKVLSENCSIIPKVVEPTVSVVAVPCLGCYLPIDPNNEELSTLMQSAVENINRIANHRSYFKLENVTSAERKVVSGWIIKLELNIIQTNCSKIVNTKVNTEECTTDMDGERGHCLTKLFLAPNGDLKDINSECFLRTGLCLHCPVDVDKNDPEIQALMKSIIEDYNLKNHTKLYNVVNVTEATRKMEAGKKQYNLKFLIQATNCSKSDHDALGDECAIDQQSSPLACEFNTDVENESTNSQLGYKCVSFVLARMATVKGFSPLRSALPSRRGRRESENPKGKGHEQNPQREEKHGKMDKKEKKDHKKKKDHGKKKDHKQKKDESSEESEENHKKKPEAHQPGFEIPRDKVTQQPTVLEKITMQPVIQAPTGFIPESPSSSHPTTIPHNEGTLTPDLSFSTLAADYKGPTINEAVLDFPLKPPPNTPKCPSKVWQPMLIIPTFAIEEPFVIDGLLPAVDDLDLPEDLPEDQNQSTGLNTNNLLTDEDLISGLGF